MSFFLSIDQSTSATKAILFSTDGQVVGKAALDHQQLYPKPGWVEQDAEEIWRNTLAAAKTLAGDHPEKLKEIVGLSLTNQRETIVVFDRKTGQPLYPAMVWQCRRGVEICRELVDTGHEPLVKQQTGLRLDTYFSASKLKWLIDANPGLKQKLEQGQAMIGTMDAYLIYRLTGGRVFASDPSNACRTLLFDIERSSWSEALCELFDVPVKSLPEIRESGARFGETDLGGVLPSAIPICGVMGDSQASLFAQHCFDPGMAKVTFGTGSSLLLNIGSTLRRAGEGAVTTLAWTHNNRTTYCYEGIINYSAATIAWLKNQLGLIDSAAETEAMATAVKDNGGVYIVPAFAGLGAPYWKPDARGAIVGLSGHSNRNHVVRAALESIAYQIRDALDMMREDAKLDLRQIHADGGPTQNRFLMQFCSDMLGIPILVSKTPDCSAMGAMMMGLLGLGYCRSLDELDKLSRENTAYQPSMDEAGVNKLYGAWKVAVNRAL